MAGDFEMDARNEEPPVRTRRVGATGQAGSAAILNGFGRSLGDSIVGLQALTLALEARTIAPDPVLLRLPGLPSITRQLYNAAHHMASVENLPWADEKPGPPPSVAGGFSRVIDLRDFAFDPGFRGVAMIDFFLQRLDLDPGQVPARAEAQPLAGIARATSAAVSEARLHAAVPHSSAADPQHPDAGPRSRDGVALRAH